MKNFGFIGMIDMPVIGNVSLQKESKQLEEGRPVASYLFNDKPSANKFADAVKNYVKNAEVVGGDKKKKFKVRLQLDKDKAGKNKNTIKIVSLAQRNMGKIDVREQEFLKNLTGTVFKNKDERDLEDWSKDTQSAVEKGETADEEGNDVEDEEI
jgi:hypothetical protein